MGDFFSTLHVSSNVAGWDGKLTMSLSLDMYVACWDLHIADHTIPFRSRRESFVHTCRSNLYEIRF